jgi:7-keto-8-aminopelargonate synthetase-like enzyme
MPKGMTIKGAKEEELMEAKSLLDNFAEDAGEVINSMNRNEELDHKNDRIRGEVMGFQLKSMESYNAKDYEGMQRNLHAATQRLNEQGIIDEKDDIPRTQAKIRILKLQMSAIHTSDKITRLIERCGKAKK